jgi:hypothetical protein
MRDIFDDSDARSSEMTEERYELEDALVYLACAWLKAQGGDH